VTRGPDVLLSVTMVRPDERLLLDSLRATGVSVETALVADIGNVLNGSTPPPAVALLRNLSHREAAGIAHRLGHLGVPTLNSGTAIDICHDKGKQALLFGRHGVPHPTSRHAFGHDQVRDIASSLGWPVVVKPLSGSWGRGVVRLTDLACLEAWTGGRESADPAGKLFPVLVQEYVEKPGHDLRVVVVGTEPVVAVERRSADWRTNTHLGATVWRTEVTPVIRDLCDRVVALLGPGFYGVDLVQDVRTGVVKVLEVNANPEFAKSSAQHGVDVGAHLAAFLADRVRDLAAA
jgi:[lysine-biosynthesis-protein LysW]---L-2-aminoadipate ligase